MALELNLTKPSETKFFFNPIASGLRIISVSQEIWGVIVQPLKKIKKKEKQKCRGPASWNAVYQLTGKMGAYSGC